MNRFIILVSVAIVADSIHAQEFTEGNTNVYRHRNSTARITQDGPLSEFWVERDFGSQTIIRRSRGNSAVIRQSRRRNYIAPPPEINKDFQNRFNYKSRSGIELHTSKEFRRLFLDRFNHKYGR